MKDPNMPEITLTLIDGLHPEPKRFRNVPVPPKKKFKIFYKKPKHSWIELEDISTERAVISANYYMHKYYGKNYELQIAFIREMDKR